MLGELIVKLGGNPLFRTCNQGRSLFWCGKNPSPVQNICQFLRINIEGEEKAIEGYRMRICEIKDVQVQKVLERIILDEEHHIKIFNQYLKEFKC